MTSKDRPCWRCGLVIPGVAAAWFRRVKMIAVTCPECGAKISLYGQPQKKRSTGK